MGGAFCQEVLGPYLKHHNYSTTLRRGVLVATTWLRADKEVNESMLDHIKLKCLAYTKHWSCVCLVCRFIWFYLHHLQCPCRLCPLNLKEQLLEPWESVRAEQGHFSKLFLSKSISFQPPTAVSKAKEDSTWLCCFFCYSPLSKFQWRQNIWTTSPTCSRQVPPLQCHHPSSSSSFSPFHPCHHPFYTRCVKHAFSKALGFLAT